MDKMEEALEILKDYGPEFKGGLSNHGPMAVEALFKMKCYDDIIPWVNFYKERLEEHPKTQKTITHDEFTDQLSNYERIGDWIAFFDQELKNHEWTLVLNDWLPKLIPGLLAAATHGIIRTAHAVRSILRSETPLRIHELAEGLGYWAARYLRLPENKDEIKGMIPADAIKEVKLLPKEERIESGLISDGIKKLEEFPDFKGVINYVNTSIAPSTFLSNLTETGANLYLANADNPKKIITFIHGVTAISAIRILVPYMPPRTVQEALRYGWQACAALYSAYGKTIEMKEIEVPVGDFKKLIQKAVETKHEHVIKFTEACLREFLMNTNNNYLKAAKHAIENLK